MCGVGGCVYFIFIPLQESITCNYSQTHCAFETHSFCFALLCFDLLLFDMREGQTISNRSCFKILARKIEVYIPRECKCMKCCRSVEFPAVYASADQQVQSVNYFRTKFTYCKFCMYKEIKERWRGIVELEFRQL